MSTESAAATCDDAAVMQVLDQNKKRKPRRIAAAGLQSLPNTTRWIAVSSGRVRAKIHPKVAPVCTPACRVVTSIYTLRLKRWRPERRL
jgi:hypothetical protein